MMSHHEASGLSSSFPFLTWIVLFTIMNKAGSMGSLIHIHVPSCFLKANYFVKLCWGLVISHGRKSVAGQMLCLFLVAWNINELAQVTNMPTHKHTTLQSSRDRIHIKVKMRLNICSPMLWQERMGAFYQGKLARRDKTDHPIGLNLKIRFYAIASYCNIAWR